MITKHMFPFIYIIYVFKKNITNDIKNNGMRLALSVPNGIKIFHKNNDISVLA